ncbi:Mn2+-dependent serine/threonine protein kinase [Striga asiatica]|uniref:Mn2+-dependent serine/threonine protein kinase n=1 Tax=Striga asiatica TaxID=4170 RepID=A0A5A7QZR3_STRAF|nr:Mn2+-dependent serine/threonine protein kinase [Striga asiatica]
MAADVEIFSGNGKRNCCGDKQEHEQYYLCSSFHGFSKEYRGLSTQSSKLELRNPFKFLFSSPNQDLLNQRADWWLVDELTVQFGCRRPVNRNWKGKGKVCRTPMNGLFLQVARSWDVLIPPYK